jgi:HK97 family phage portal protein
VSILRGLSAERRSSGGTGVLLSQAAIPPPGYYYPTDSGETVNTDSAMRLAAVWACVNLLTDITAPLGWHAFRQMPDGIQVQLPDHPILINPSNEPSLSAADWRAQMMRSLLLRGNAYGLIKQTGSHGEPTKIQIIHPDYVSVVRLGPLGPFEFRVLGERKDLWQAGGDLWHVPAYTVPGTPVGLSPIDYARQQIGLGLASEAFGAKWFGDGAIPSAVLSTDQQLTGEQATVMKQRWNEAIHGNRSVAVLGAGLDFTPITVSPDESQFIETSRLNATAIARIFGVPPEMIGADGGTTNTYINVESKMAHLLVLSARPWIVRLEHALSALLRSTDNIRANTDELLRTDAKTRVDIQTQRLRMGTRSVNEIRAEDNMPPLPNDLGDEFLWPPFATKNDQSDTYEPKVADVPDLVEPNNAA